jgi:hypothetical protein
MKAMRNAAVSAVLLLLVGVSGAHATVSWVKRPKEEKPAAAPPLPSPALVFQQPNPSLSQEAAEIQEASDPQREVAKRLNLVNPMSEDATAVPGAAGLAAMLGPQSALGKILSDPRVQKLQKIALDEEFQKTLAQVLKAPDIKMLPWFELAWVVIIFLFSAWKGATIQGVLKILLFRIGISTVFVSGSSLFIPWFVIGDSYLRLARMLWDVI